MSLYKKHLLTSFFLLFILVGTLFLSSDYIRAFLLNPYKYLSTDLNINTIYFLVVFILLIIVVVFGVFIFYLLVTFNTRFKLQIWSATKSIALSQEEFQKLYDNAPVPYIMIGQGGEIHQPNKAALRFFEVLPENIEDKNLFSFITEEYRVQGELCAEYYRKGIPIDRKEVDFITKNGSTKSVLLSIFKLSSLSGTSKNTGLAMIFDVTEQKALSKAKTEFVSLASHQLRTPLATIKWYTEMLLAPELGPLNDKQKDYVYKLNLVNKDMIDLVEILLNVSRIEMGSLPIAIKSTNIGELTDGILAEFYPQIEKKKLNINKKYDGLLDNMNIDPKLLRIVIHNILSNAIKYNSDGGTVSITFEDSGEKKKKIIISDTGIGIPKEDQGRIFSKLFRAKNAVSLNSSQGTGLGLYLIKSITESMGGSVGFLSEENKGSTFTLKF